MFFPRTPHQREYAELLEKPVGASGTPDIVVAMGPAGTSKTLGATLVGLQKLVDGEVDRLVMTRPAVCADEQLGFLPGTLEDKMHVWLLPIMDSLRMVMKKEEIDRLMSSESIEVCSLAHMRGRTFRKSYVIVDECQNTSPSQMLMLTTRIGEGSRFVFTGDPYQHDRGTELSGLDDFITRLRLRGTALPCGPSSSRSEPEPEPESGSESGSGSGSGCSRGGEGGDGAGYDDDDDGYAFIRVVQFERSDVQRHRVIPQILEMYN